MTKKQIIEEACESFKVLIDFFDSKKEFSSDKFCNEFKKDIMNNKFKKKNK